MFNYPSVIVSVGFYHCKLYHGCNASYSDPFTSNFHSKVHLLFSLLELRYLVRDQTFKSVLVKSLQKQTNKQTNKKTKKKTMEFTVEYG